MRVDPLGVLKVGKSVCIRVPDERQRGSIKISQFDQELKSAGVGSIKSVKIREEFYKILYRERGSLYVERVANYHKTVGISSCKSCPCVREYR